MVPLPVVLYMFVKVCTVTAEVFFTMDEVTLLARWYNALIPIHACRFTSEDS